MKAALLIILFLFISCTSPSSNSHSSLTITDIDLSTATYPEYVRNPSEFTLHNDEFRLSIYTRFYHETKIISETILIVDDHNETYYERIIIFDPPLEPLTNYNTERSECSWHIFKGDYEAWPSGYYVLHVWVTDNKGNDSTYITVDLNILGKSLN